MNLNIGDNVIYGVNGLCEIMEVTSCNLSGTEREYYVLELVFERNMRIYVPTDNEKMLKQIRFALTREDAVRLIDNMPEREAIWISNEHLSKEKYKEIINRANLNELVSLIKTLYLKRLEREKAGKRLFVSDEAFLKNAEKLLYDELAAALGIRPEEVVDYITEKLKDSVEA